MLAQETPTPRSAFAAFETIVLPNGLKVWFRRLPGESGVSLTVSVGVGSDQDPLGREEMAHFLEHLQFSDHLGRTEEQIKREIEDRGGAWNGFTTSDHTYYVVDIDRAHGLFALAWLSRILSPHAMDPAVVERERSPVSLEVGARARQVFDWIQARYVDPPWLRPPGFWRREFGLATRYERDYYPYRSIRSISPDELRRFYDRWYAPERITLTIAGDLDRGPLLAAIRATFGALPGRRGAVPADAVRLADGAHAAYSWAPRADVLYQARYRVARRSAADDVMLEFLSAWLRRRLNNKLRFGDRKAVYTAFAWVTRRGPAAYLGIEAPLRPSELAWGRGVIEGELEALRRGTIPDSEFAADRAGIARQLRVQSASAKDVVRWAVNVFYDRRLHRDFPDLVAAFETMTRADLQRFARDRLAPERRSLRIVYPLPVSQGVLALSAALVLALAVRLARRLLITPLDVTRLRYVARMRLPWPYLLSVVPWYVAVVAALLRLLVYGWQVLVVCCVLGLPSAWLQWACYAAMLALTVLVLVFALSRWPRKLLVQEGSVVVKYLSFRSVTIPAAEIAELAPLRLREVWLTRRLWKCLPLTLGLLGPGIYLRQRGGWAWYFGVRDAGECLTALRGMRELKADG